MKHWLKHSQAFLGLILSSPALAKETVQNSNFQHLSIFAGPAVRFNDVDNKVTRHFFETHLNLASTSNFEEYLLARNIIF